MPWLEVDPDRHVGKVPSSAPRRTSPTWRTSASSSSSSSIRSKERTWRGRICSRDSRGRRASRSSRARRTRTTASSSPTLRAAATAQHRQHPAPDPPVVDPGLRHHGGADDQLRRGRRAHVIISEFEAIPEVVEDTPEILNNLKQLQLELPGRRGAGTSCRAQGPRQADRPRTSRSTTPSRC